MGRAKLRMELMSNKKARHAAFEKRKKGLEKAAYELSILCGVDIGMIIYGPSAPTNECNEPNIWPRNGEVVSRLINSYTSRQDFDSKYRTYDLSAYFKDKTQRVEEEIKKMRGKTREAKFPKWNDKYNYFSKDEMKEFDHMLMAKIDNVRERINLMKGSRSLYTESNFLMNPAVQERVFFMPDIVQKQQPVAYYDALDVLMNESVQESAMFMPNIVQQQQPMAYYDHNQGNKANLMEGSRNLYLESKFLMNQKGAFFMPDIVQQQQQPLAYYDNQENMGDLMEGTGSLYLDSKLLMNIPSVQESKFVRPDIFQQQQPLAYYDAQGNMVMMMGDGASCSRVIYS